MATPIVAALRRGATSRASGARSFDAWHRHIFGASIADRYARTQRAALPVFPAWLWLGWVADTLAQTTAKPSTLRKQFLNLKNWLRGTGWDVSRVDEVTPLVNNAIDNAYALHTDSPPVRRPGRPVLPEQGLEDITDAIDAYFDDPKVSDFWVHNMRTFHLLAWFSGARIGELTVRARRSWQTFEGDRLHVEFPAGLKFQDEDRVITIDPHPLDARYCAVAAVKQLKQTASKAGISTGPDDPVFGWARMRSLSTRKPSKRAALEEWSLRKQRANTRWMADPIRLYLDDPAWMAGEDPAFRLYTAELNQQARFRQAWKKMAAVAGFFPRHALERVSPHGIRRGRATTLSKAGARSPQVAAMLRHAGLSVTADYIDISALDPLDVSALIGEAPHPEVEHNSQDAVASLSEVLAAAGDPGADVKDFETRLCQVPMRVGGLCGRPATRSLIEWGPICEAHQRRARAGQAMDVPIPEKSGPLPRCQVVMDTAVICGRKGARRDLDGFGLACLQHCRRFDRGEPMGTPFRRQSPKAQRCQVLMASGELCGKGGGMFSDPEFSWICASHHDRRKKGTPMGQPWKRVSPKDQRCEVRMAADKLCAKGGRMNWLEAYGWACESHATRHRTGQDMSKPWARRAPKGQTCEVLVSADEMCARTGPMIWVEGRGWTCGGHYQRSVTGRPMGTPIGSLRSSEDHNPT